MRYRIAVYNTVSTESAGGLTQTRTLLFNSWADIKPLSQARALAYGLTETNRVHELTVRYRATLTTKQTIDATINGVLKTLTISSILNTDNRDKEMKLICTEDD